MIRPTDWQDWTPADQQDWLDREAERAEYQAGRKAEDDAADGMDDPKENDA